LKNLTQREIRLFISAVYWRRQYDDSNPDVGMGPADWMLLEEIIKEVRIEVSDADRKEILSGVWLKRRK
jgi:hypothetical protein